MEVSFEREGETIVAAVSGRLDTISAQAFAREMDGVLAGGEKVVVFDLAGLDYVSSAGLRVILSTAKTLKAREGEIRLAAMSGPVNKVLQIAGLLAMFKNYATRSEALAES